MFEKLKNVEACLWLGRILAKKVVRASKLIREKEAIKSAKQGENQSDQDNQPEESEPAKKPILTE